MEEVIIYEKPTCSKCRIALQILNEKGVPYRSVRYHDTPLGKSELSALIKKMGIAPKELLRTEDPIYKAPGLRPESLNDAEIIDLMIAHPDLMQRPILERGDKAIIGRPTERVMEFLHEN